MSFVVVLAATCAFVAVAAKSIRAVPWLWYAIALGLDIVYAYGIVYELPPAVLQVLSVVVQRGILAMALFVVVMYSGVFPRGSRVTGVLGPIRAELSIIACILALAHCVNYLDSYIGILLTNVAVIGMNQFASLVLALVLFAMLIVLGATSLKSIRRHMKAATWKNIQRSSYVFFGLIYVHALLVLYPSAIKGVGDALPTLVAGGVVFGLYYVLRISRHLSDKKKLQGNTVSSAKQEEYA
ncbi:MAG: hypothetical protein AB2L09_11735 [Coriobacteriia bacterium]